LDALLVPPDELTNKTKWQGPYIDHQELPVDPWNNAFQYKALSDTEFHIWSNGPDGIDGSKDDIR
jgi:Bacterial type II secretion system protein G.